MGCKPCKIVTFVMIGFSIVRPNFLMTSMQGTLEAFVMHMANGKRSCHDISRLNRIEHDIDNLINGHKPKAEPKVKYIARASDDIMDLRGEGLEYLLNSESEVIAMFIDGVMNGLNNKPNMTVKDAIGKTITIEVA